MGLQAATVGHEPRSDTGHAAEALTGSRSRDHAVRSSANLRCTLQELSVRFAVLSKDRNVIKKPVDVRKVAEYMRALRENVSFDVHVFHRRGE